MRSKKQSKLIEIEAKQKTLHKKLQVLISEEIKSRRKNKSTQLKVKGDNILAMIMKESAQNLLELETKAKNLVEDNQMMREKLGIKEKVSVQMVLDVIGRRDECEEIEVERNEDYLLCIDDIADIIMIRFQHLDFKELASQLAGNIENERLRTKQLHLENIQIFQSNKKILSDLEAEAESRGLHFI
jgi:hypothetical protein